MNEFINSKLKPYISRMDAIELLLRQKDNSVLFDKIEALEKFIDKLDRVEPQNNKELISRIEKLEKKNSESNIPTPVISDKETIVKPIVKTKKAAKKVVSKKSF
jgi:hypothetical protein